eukprot:scaffold220412_cov28-Tisochrysis_lutea.AAC.1
MFSCSIIVPSLGRAVDRSRVSDHFTPPFYCCPLPTAEPRVRMNSAIYSAFCGFAKESPPWRKFRVIRREADIYEY